MGWKRIAYVTSLVIILVAVFWPGTSFDTGLIKGKRVLVTGASSGIGEQIAYQYAQNGASVFITARREALLKQVINKCQEIGSPEATFGYIAADMAEMDQTRLVIDAATSHLGGLDQLILNHGYIMTARPWTDTQESFELLKKILDVNTRSFAQLAAQALPHLKVTNGSIGVISSLAGKFGLPLFAPYSASKFALDGFFSGFRGEVAKYNVSVTLVVVGAVGTERMHFVVDDIGHTYANAKVDLANSRFAPAPPDKCAYEIMRSTTSREREAYFPPSQFVKQLVLLKEIVVRVGSSFSAELGRLIPR